MTSNACLKTWLVAVVAVIACGQQAHAQWPTDFQNLGCNTYFELGAKIYDRPGDDFGVPVIVDGLTNATLLSSGDLTDLNGGAGAEARVGWSDRHCRKWELRTFLTNWDSDYFFNNANLTSPLSPMLDPDQVEIFYDSQLYSIELSRRAPLTPGITFLFGPRFVALNEDLLFTSETLIPTPPLGSFNLQTNNRIDTRNAFVGGQIGALMNYQVSRDIYFQGSIRAGGYTNFHSLRTASSSSIMATQVNTIRDETSAFIGEVGGKVYVDIFPGNLAAFVGYEATWIDGVALAPAQASTLVPNTLVTGVTPFFQAIHLGLQFRR